MKEPFPPGQASAFPAFGWASRPAGEANPLDVPAFRVQTCPLSPRTTCIRNQKLDSCPSCSTPSLVPCLPRPQRRGLRYFPQAPTMPADDAMLSPPADHESPAARPTCPPEESRLHTPEPSNREPSLHARGDGGGAFMSSGQQSTPPPSDRDRRMNRSPSAESQSSSQDTETDADVPPRDTPTPMSASRDTRQEQHSARSSPAPQRAPSLPIRSQYSSYKSPFPSLRVRTLQIAGSGTPHATPV